MKIRTACYCRCSTQEQRLHGYSIVAQQDTLKRYAETHDLEITGWYLDEGISGRKPIKKRPALQRMLNDAEHNMFVRIIFIKLDRYFRSVGEYYACQKILDAHGILWSATNEEYDLTTATGRLLVTQKLAVAEYEADTTSERIKLVNEYKVRQGTALYGSHTCHIGFKVEQTPTGKRVVIDREKEHIARDIIQTFLQYQSYYGTITRINDKYGLSFTNSMLKSFLRDTKLYGFYRGNENYCEPYITKEDFDRIQSLLPRNIKRTPSKNVYYFVGLIRCPECGSILVGYSNHKCQYVRCGKAAIHRQCSYRRIVSQIDLERQLLESLNSKIGNYIREVEARPKDSHANDTAPIKKEMSRLNKMFQKGRIDEKEYDREYESLRIRLAEMEKLNTGEADLTRYYEMLKQDWKDEYALLEKEGKQAFWRNLIREIVINEDRVIEKVIFF